MSAISNGIQVEPIMTDQDAEDAATREAGIEHYAQELLERADRGDVTALDLIDDAISGTGWSTARQFCLERDGYEKAIELGITPALALQVVGTSLFSFYRQSAWKAALWDYDRWLAESIERAADNYELRDEVLGSSI